MRCPRCQFISSDSNANCPKCQADLRAAKAAAGLPVGSSPLQPEQKTPPASAATRTPPSQKNAAAPKRPPAPREVPLPPKKTPPVAAEQSDNAVASAPMVPSAPVAPAPRLKGAEELRGSIFKIHQPGATWDDVEATFDEAYTECLQFQEQAAVELTPEYLRAGKRDSAIEALFDLAFDVVAHPERETQLVEKFTTSDQRHVESKSLATELAQIENKISLPVFGLRGLRERAALARQAESAEPIKELLPATIVQRFGAFLVDSGCCLLFGAIVVGALSALVDPAFFKQLKNFPELSDATLISTVTLVLATATLLFILYPMLSLLSFNRTLGQHLCGIKLTTELGRRLKLPHILVRCLLFPLSAALFGYLSLLVGKRSLHDALARTKVAQA